jgi:hypothetical protein
MRTQRKTVARSTNLQTSFWFGGAILAVIVFLYAATWPPAYSDWKQSPAHVVETRIVTVGVFDGGAYAGPSNHVLYRLESHVSYTANGKSYEEWLPASDNVANKQWLSFRLSRRTGNDAEVTWNPRDPAQGRVSLHLPYP